MQDFRLKEKLRAYKNFVLLGEAGSGKSEIGLNLAIALSEEFPQKEVHLFDMDQTKPLFRSRDAGKAGKLNRVIIHYQEQIMDSPIMVGGVEAAIMDSSKYVIMDIGGGEQGAKLIGQYSELLQGDESIVLYVVNSFRPWSRNRNDFAETMRQVLGGCGLERVCYVANPNLGCNTSPEDVTQGYKMIKDNLRIEPQFICVLSGQTVLNSSHFDIPVFPIELMLATSRIEQMKPF